MPLIRDMYVTGTQPPQWWWELISLMDRRLVIFSQIGFGLEAKWNDWLSRSSIGVRVWRITCLPYHLSSVSRYLFDRRRETEKLLSMAPNPKHTLTHSARIGGTVYQGNKDRVIQHSQGLSGPAMRRSWIKVRLLKCTVHRKAMEVYNYVSYRPPRKGQFHKFFSLLPTS